MMRDIAANHQLELEKPLNDVNLNTGGPNFDWHQYGLSIFTPEEITEGQMLDDVENWMNLAIAEADIQLQAHHDQLDLPEGNILHANERQMIILGVNILHLLMEAKGDPQDQLRLLVQGAGGTGKTFVIANLTRICRRLFSRNASTLNLAPTGAASNLIPDGRTVHSVLPPSRSKKEVEKDKYDYQLSDYEMSRKLAKRLRAITGTVNDGIKLKMVNMDERSMYGQPLIAFASHRLCQAVLDMTPLFGGVPVVNFFGDISQLGPVGASGPHNNPGADSSSITKKGFAIYRSFDHAIVLNESMRQQSDQKELKERLECMRTGAISMHHWQQIMSRLESNLPETEVSNFTHHKTLTVTETWLEADEINLQKLADLGVPVAIIHSKGRGKHHSGNTGQVGQIIGTCILAVGCSVILSKNQESLTSFGLNNGSPGICRSILYKQDQSPPALPLAVVVEFESYTGPPWLHNHPKLVPIPVNEAHCDYDCCCTRVGIPLMPSYALPIAKVQGRTIGKGKAATHLRVKLQSKITMEQLCLGLSYTAFSRCQEEQDWCLVDAIPWERLSYINQHPQQQKRKRELERIESLSENTMKRYNITPRKFLDLLQELDEFVNDGINDAICSEPKPCKCIACVYGS